MYLFLPLCDAILAPACPLHFCNFKITPSQPEPNVTHLILARPFAILPIIQINALAMQRLGWELFCELQPGPIPTGQQHAMRVMQTGALQLRKGSTHVRRMPRGGVWFGYV